MPMHRSHPENLQDPIRFKNLLKQLEESLLQEYSTIETKQLLEPFETLSNDTQFWNHAERGLAVLGSAELFKVIRLQNPVEELAVVADSFHTKPLRKYLQSVDRYQVLGLSLHDIRFFEGNRHSLSEVALSADLPKTIEEALGEELTDKHSTVASYGGVGGGSSNMHHGHGARKDELDIDAERFFRVIAGVIDERFSKPSGLPLILAALPEHHHLFHEVNKNPLLLPKGIAINPKSVSINELAKMAWEVMEPDYFLRLENLAARFSQAQANGTGSDNLEEVVRAASAGRVDTLLIEADRIIPGKIINSDTGEIQTSDLQHPETDDLLDDIGELVTMTGGNVALIPQDKMPSTTGLAAIYRY